MDTGEHAMGAEAVVSDTDLDDEPITLPDGTELDETAVAVFGEGAIASADARRPPGRPSLTGTSAHSPKVSARVTPETRQALQDFAQREGRRPAEVVRQALEEYLAAHAG